MGRTLATGRNRRIRWNGWKLKYFRYRNLNDLASFYAHRETLNEHFAAERPRAPAQKGDAVLCSQTVLIVDEDGYASLDLSEAIEESDGYVAGPVATLFDTLTILDSTRVCGAIVDCQLADALEVVMLLAERRVPLVIQVSASLPCGLGDLKDKASVLMRPVDPQTTLEALLVEIGKSETRTSNALASAPKQV